MLAETKVTLGQCIKCGKEQSLGYFQDHTEVFARLHIMKDGVVKVASFYCHECLSPFWDLQKRVDEEGQRLIALRQEYVSTETRLREIAKKLASTGPIAITEHILVVYDGQGPVRLKVIDHRKGYWAEAPLNADSIFQLGKLFTSGRSSQLGNVTGIQNSLF